MFLSIYNKIRAAHPREVSCMYRSIVLISMSDPYTHNYTESLKPHILWSAVEVGMQILGDY